MVEIVAGAKVKATISYLSSRNTRVVTVNLPQKDDKDKPKSGGSLFGTVGIKPSSFPSSEKTE
jgi:hypothetical protein